MNELKIENKKFDKIICLKGDLPSKDEFNLLKDITLIAADGAYNELYNLEITPDIVVGDMDSIKNENISEGIELFHLRDQNTNDFEKCILYLDENSNQDILILGLNGGVLEHTLNNMSVLKKYIHKHNFTIYHKGRYCIHVSEDRIFHISEKEIISIIPFFKAKITTQNLKWELKEEYLEIGIREGARNISTDTKVKIILHEGEYFFFFNSSLPYCPRVLH